MHEDEQKLSAWLGVFARGCTLEAAEAICHLDGGPDVLEGLSSLIDKSLLQQRDDRGESRFVMLETLREAIGASPSSYERTDHERNLATVRAGLSEGVFRATWAEGRAMTLEQGIAYALEQTPP